MGMALHSQHTAWRARAGRCDPIRIAYRGI